MTSLYFFIVGVCFLVLACTDRKHDTDIDAKLEKNKAMSSMLDGLSQGSGKDRDFVEKVKNTSDRFQKFASSAGNLAGEVEKNVHLANAALGKPGTGGYGSLESSGLDSDGEVRGKNAVPRPYF